MPKSTLRADARQSREKILAAFRELIAERGGDVPMYEIARRAGVGQGTLYRHFPTRASLAAAVFERTVDDLERIAEAGRQDPELFQQLLVASAEGMVQARQLSVVLTGRGPDSLELRHLANRNLQLFKEPIRVAQRAGLLREDFKPRDVLTLMAMIDGVLGGIGDEQERTAAARRALDFILAGIRP